MRFLVKVNIPVETGNGAAKAGKLGATIQAILEDLCRPIGQIPNATEVGWVQGSRSSVEMKENIVAEDTVCPLITA
jgi:hypothetical protein